MAWAEFGPLHFWLATVLVAFSEVVAEGVPCTLSPALTCCDAAARAAEGRGQGTQL